MLIAQRVVAAISLLLLSAALLSAAPQAKGAAASPSKPTAGTAVPAPPLIVEAATFATVSPDGRVDPRSSVFRPGEEVHIAVAVSGFGSRAITTGVRVEFQVGVQIRNGSGATIARSNEFDNLVEDAASAPSQYRGDVRLTLPSLKAGSYVLHLTLRDPTTAKGGTAELAFSIMPDV